jgi:hypothetical protein
MATARVDSLECPNCLHRHGVKDSCFLGVLLAVVHFRREGLTPEQVKTVYEKIDVDRLWERFGGPAADYIERLLDE